ncbi:MAG: fructosamine kinase family protein [Nocardioidaceae bacterium]|nr:fructosamine kinase family protein [Nocardioidaceae bacterium]MDQ3324548.1 fructosamine kinase family protein [Actinomycetota bacterium]
MARMGTVAARAEQLLGRAVVATVAVPGGGVCTATKARLSDGSSVLVKSRPHPPAGFFAAEAAGLQWLAEATDVGGVPVPEVRAVADDCLIMAWVEPGRPSTEAAERLGRALAATHRAGAETFGLADVDSTWIGTMPLPQRGAGNWAGSWAEFWAAARIEPYLRLACDRTAITETDADAVHRVLARVIELAGPAEPPARVHGDLWSGNVVWSGEARAYLVDPAAHGGHRETDLAMLALFGLPQLERVLTAYTEASPLAEGWRARVPLHQLHPLLVHAAMFGGSYGARAGAAARAALEPQPG